MSNQQHSMRKLVILICFITCGKGQNVTNTWLESPRSLVRLWKKYIAPQQLDPYRAPLETVATTRQPTLPTQHIVNVINATDANTWRHRIANGLEKFFPQATMNQTRTTDLNATISDRKESWIDSIFKTQNKTANDEDHKISAKKIPEKILEHTTPAVILDEEAEDFDDFLPGTILSGLHCLPDISMKSCVDHCVESLPPAANNDGVDMSADLMPPPPGRSFRMPWSAALFWKSSQANKTPTHIERDRKKENLKGGASDPPSSGRIILDNKQWQELQLCLLLICVPDYMIAPIPGCVGPNGAIVTETAAKDSPATSLDQYNPAKLNFYRGIGYFTIGRLLRNLFPESAAAGVLGAFTSAIFNAIVFLVMTVALILLPTVLYHGLWPLTSNFREKVESNQRSRGLGMFEKSNRQSTVSPECALDTA